MKEGLQAVILAGGQGTRLRPLTAQMPKVMVEVGGKPFLEHVILLLRRYGVSDVLLLVGYLGEHVQRYFGDGSLFGLSIRYSFESRGLLGTAGALKNAQSLLTERFMLLNGDTYMDVDYRQVCSRLVSSGKEGVMVVCRNPKRPDPGNVLIGADDCVVSYQKDDPSGTNGTDAGVMALDRRMLSRVPAGRPVSLEREIIPAMIEDGQMVAFPTDNLYYDMGTVPGLKSAEKRLL